MKLIGKLNMILWKLEGGKHKITRGISDCQDAVKQSGIGECRESKPSARIIILIRKEFKVFLVNNRNE